eukprot:4928327-Prymnesium_polylepis.1
MAASLGGPREQACICVLKAGYCPGTRQRTQSLTTASPCGSLRELVGATARQHVGLTRPSGHASTVRSAGWRYGQRRP